MQRGLDRPLTEEFPALFGTLELGSRIRKSFAYVGIVTVRDLIRRTRQELLEIAGLGPRSVELIEGAMADRGLIFGMPPEKAEYGLMQFAVEDIHKELLLIEDRLARIEKLLLCLLHGPDKRRLDAAELRERRKVYEVLKESECTN
jgi:CBS domain-containing protein